MTSKLAAFCCLFLAGIVTVNSLHFPGFINGKPLRHHFDKLRLPNNAAADNCAEESMFSQIVDHFNSSNTAKWDQRVQVNAKFFNPNVTDQPVIFFMIGGESPAEQKWVCREDYTYMKLAKENNALVIQLEHRFFGKSYPLKNGTMGDMSTATLRLLTSQQALEDLANFIKTYKFKNITWTNPKWVIFGGSYPGSLCAWFRADPRYANLTLGGICSSAPLWAKLDFYEYAEVIEYAFTNLSATQKTNCDQLIKEGFYQLRQNTFTDSGRAMLNRVFNIVPPLNATTNNFDLYATNFLANVFSVFQNIDQYTFDARDNITESGYDIAHLCNIMLQSSEPVTGIKNIYYWDPLNPNASTSGKSLDNDYYGDMAYYSQSWYDYTDSFQSDVAAGRGWMWLCCGMALGWLQTTDNANGMFNRAIPLNYYLQQCSDMFGSEINTKYVTEKVAQIGYVFPPPWNYTATNVVLPNGDYDPWHALSSYVTDTTRHQISALTHGAAHCSDMYPEMPNEPAALNATRQIVINEVRYYLTLNAATSAPPSTSPPPTSPPPSVSPTSIGSSTQSSLTPIMTISTVSPISPISSSPTIPVATGSSSPISMPSTQPTPQPTTSGKSLPNVLLSTLLLLFVSLLL